MLQSIQYDPIVIYLLDYLMKSTLTKFDHKRFIMRAVMSAGAISGLSIDTNFKTCLESKIDELNALIDSVLSHCHLPFGLHHEVYTHQV